MKRALAALLGSLAVVAATAGEVPAPLRVCLADDSLPYSAVVDGVPSGFDVGLWRVVAARLQRPLALQWFEGRYDKEGNLSLDARALLAADLCDLVAGVPLYAPQLAPMIADKARTPDHPGARPLRQRPYETLVPVVGGAPYRATAMVLVAGSRGAAARSLDALQGQSVAVRAGSMAALALSAWHGGRLSASLRGLNLNEDVLAAVENGRADAALVDVALWDRYRRQQPTSALRPTGFEHPVKLNIGVLVRQRDAALLGDAERVVRQLIESGEAPVLATAQQTTWIRPVTPAVRASLTLRDFDVGADDAN